MNKLFYIPLGDNKTDIKITINLAAIESAALISNESLLIYCRNHSLDFPWMLNQKPLTYVKFKREKAEHVLVRGTPEDFVS